MKYLTTLVIALFVMNITCIAQNSISRKVFNQNAISTTQSKKISSKTVQKKNSHVSSRKTEENSTLYFVAENPMVDKHTSSSISSDFITAVYIGKEGTLVEFDYSVFSNVQNPWISMSANTTLVCKGSKNPLKITDWGIKDGEGHYNPLSFDEKFTLNSGTTYTLYMGFEPVDKSIREISIYEDGYHGFFWEGIHLDKKSSIAEILDIVDNDEGQVSKEPNILFASTVTNAKQNGVDLTKQVVNDGGAQTIFYLIGEETFMSNYFTKKDTQTFGPIYDVQNSVQEETETTFKTETTTFSWNYSDSFDDKSGTCQCVLIFTYKPQGIISYLKMITETLDVIEYTGYVEGTVNL